MQRFIFYILKMRILVITKALDKPEAHILVGLKKRGVTVQVLLQEENAHAQILRDSNIPILRFPLSSRLDIKGMLTLRRIVQCGGDGLKEPRGPSKIGY